MGRARIEKRLQRVAFADYFGITRSVGEGVYEIKMDFGPGYRVYYAMNGSTVVYLLAGGDKDSQADDIRRAVAIRRTLEVRGWTLN